MRHPRSSCRPPRSTVIAILLLLTLAVTALLAYQAWEASSSHAAVARSVLDYYARLAAMNYAKSASDSIDRALASQLEPACDEDLPFSLREQLEPAEDVAPYRRGRALELLSADKEAQRMQLTEHELQQFMLPLFMGKAKCGEGASDAVLPPLNHFAIDLQTEALVTSEWSLPGPMVAKLADVAREHAKTYYLEWTRPALTLIEKGPGARAAFAFVVTRGAHPGSEQAFGFQFDPERLEAILAKVLELAVLLPAPMLGKIQNQNAVMVHVVDAAAPIARPVFRSAVEKSPYAAVQPLESRLGKLEVVVSLRPEVAGKLIIGGLPRSRLPLLGGLLALTTTLVVVALVQLRREYELVRLRGDFVSSVSHELRTPLAQIRLFTETLVLGRVRTQEEGRRALEIIDQESKRLAQLVENVLLFSRSERRVIKVVREPTEVARLVRDVADIFEPLARARQASLAVRIDGAAEPVVAALDPGALKQVLLNLIDNAVKYGPAGQTVTVGLERIGDRIRLSVEDRGPGIPAKFRERIFEPFCRLDRERQTAVAGAGIGLSVVRDLATLHGGRASVESRAEGGSRFIVELPGVLVDGEGGELSPVAAA